MGLGDLFASTVPQALSTLYDVTRQEESAKEQRKHNQTAYDSAKGMAGEYGKAYETTANNFAGESRAIKDNRSDQTHKILDAWYKDVSGANSVEAKTRGASNERFERENVLSDENKRNVDAELTKWTDMAQVNTDWLKSSTDNLLKASEGRQRELTATFNKLVDSNEGQIGAARFDIDKAIGDMSTSVAQDVLAATDAPRADRDQALTQLKVAKLQGKMTEDQYQARVREVTRNYANTAADNRLAVTDALTKTVGAVRAQLESGLMNLRSNVMGTNANLFGTYTSASGAESANNSATINALTNATVAANDPLMKAEALAVGSLTDTFKMKMNTSADVFSSAKDSFLTDNAARSQYAEYLLNNENAYSAEAYANLAKTTDLLMKSIDGWAEFEKLGIDIQRNWEIFTPQSLANVSAMTESWHAYRDRVVAQDTAPDNSGLIGAGIGAVGSVVGGAMGNPSGLASIFS